MYRVPLRFVIYLLVIFVVAGYSWLWHSWSNGKVLVMSTDNALVPHPMIKIWQLPEATSPFGPLVRFTEDNFTYRFDYYPTSSSSAYNSLLFTGESFRANAGEIRWRLDGGATAYLDTIPMFECDKNGVWRHYRR